MKQRIAVGTALAIVAIVSVLSVNMNGHAQGDVSYQSIKASAIKILGEEPKFRGCVNLMHYVKQPTVSVEEQGDFDKAIRDSVKNDDKVSVFGRTLIPCPPKCGG